MILLNNFQKISYDYLLLPQNYHHFINWFIKFNNFFQLHHMK